MELAMITVIVGGANGYDPSTPSTPKPGRLSHKTIVIICLDDNDSLRPFQPGQHFSREKYLPIV